jgi:hypothetical protein
LEPPATISYADRFAAWHSFADYVIAVWKQGAGDPCREAHQPYAEFPLRASLGDRKSGDISYLFSGPQANRAFRPHSP